MSKIRWSALNPYRHEVVLKQETFDSHIANDHDDKDATIRASLEDNAKESIKHPRYIVKDNLRDDRYQYIDIAPVTQTDTITLHFLKTIINTSRHPHEVVTWIPMRGKISVEKGGIVYDSAKGFIEEQ